MHHTKPATFKTQLLFVDWGLCGVSWPSFKMWMVSAVSWCRRCDRPQLQLKLLSAVKNQKLQSVKVAWKRVCFLGRKSWDGGSLLCCLIQYLTGVMTLVPLLWHLQYWLCSDSSSYGRKAACSNCGCLVPCSHSVGETVTICGSFLRARQFSEDPHHRSSRVLLARVGSHAHLWTNH